ncbi:unnamed protein product [Pleuronectes platessa]|uniref:Uncharacterized protein n=1 Tax=Pleuronectes platessa TaxID=8262 RepID=A0A9N7VIC1_PLEPL|nr:unnamed protein product [Pleuronectes platessa]
MVRTQKQHRQTKYQALADRSSGELCSHRAEQERNQEGIGETRGRRQKAEVISRAETRQAGRGSATGDQSGENTLEVRHNTRQSGTETETGAGLNAARAVTGVESWPDEEVWLTGRVEQRQPAQCKYREEKISGHNGVADREEDRDACEDDVEENSEDEVKDNGDDKDNDPVGDASADSSCLDEEEEGQDHVCTTTPTRLVERETFKSRNREMTWSSRAYGQEGSSCSSFKVAVRSRAGGIASTIGLFITPTVENIILEMTNRAADT